MVGALSQLLQFVTELEGFLYFCDPSPGGLFDRDRTNQVIKFGHVLKNQVDGLTVTILSLGIRSRTGMTRFGTTGADWLALSHHSVEHNIV